jgi:hypothetical protein
MELNEKIKTVLQVVVRGDNNMLLVPDGYILWFFSEDPEVLVIKEKTEKLVRLLNQAEQENDTEFLSRDVDEVIRTL